MYAKTLGKEEWPNIPDLYTTTCVAVRYVFKGELARKNNFGLFYAEFVFDFKSGKIFLLRLAIFLVFALLSVNYVTAWTSGISQSGNKIILGCITSDMITIPL